MPDVVHISGVVSADVVEEAGRRKRRRRDRGTGDHRWRPSRDHRVGVKQRHGYIAGVLFGEPEAGEATPGERGH